MIVFEDETVTLDVIKEQIFSASEMQPDGKNNKKERKNEANFSFPMISFIWSFFSFPFFLFIFFFFFYYYLWILEIGHFLQNVGRVLNKASQDNWSPSELEENLARVIFIPPPQWIVYK